MSDEAPVFPPPSPEVHPSIAKIEMGHAIDRAAEILIGAGAGHLVEDLREKHAAFDRSWYEQAMHRQGAVEAALGHTSHQPWPATVAEIAADHELSRHVRLAGERLLEDMKS